MSDKRDDDTTPARPGPAGEDGKSTASPTSRELLVSGDPLGLVSPSEPDAPSRHPRPKIVSLLGEFFKMSRTTAILLATFVLIGALYAVVKDEPVVGIGTPPPQSSTAETEPVETPPSSTEESETATETSVPTTSAPTEVSPEDSASESLQTTAPSSDRLGNRTTQQAPQGTQQQQQIPQQQQQQTQQQQPQLQPQRVPEAAATGPTGGDQAAE